MSANTEKRTWPIFVSGVLNCILGIVHQIILYFTYQNYMSQITAASGELLSDYLLFSMAIGTVIFFIGLLTCYSYRGVVQGEKRSIITCAGICGLLFLFAIKIFVIFGPSHPIAYVHLINSLLIATSLMLRKKVGRSQTRISDVATGK